jgi:hypothetical protein
MSGQRPPDDERALPKRLVPLARRLASLSAEERRAVIDAAASIDPRPVASWASLDEATGVVSLGGDAVEDTAGLYDG